MGTGSSSSSSGADCKLRLTIVRPNLLSMPEMLSNWTDGYIHIGTHSVPTHIGTQCRHLFLDLISEMQHVFSFSNYEKGQLNASSIRCVKQDCEYIIRLHHIPMVKTIVFASIIILSLFLPKRSLADKHETYTGMDPKWT